MATVVLATDFKTEKMKSVVFSCATDFQYITTEKRQQPISKTEKIKSVAEITFH